MRIHACARALLPRLYSLRVQVKAVLAGRRGSKVMSACVKEREGAREAEGKERVSEREGGREEGKEGGGEGEREK